MYSVDFVDQVAAKPEKFQSSVSFSETDIISVKELITARVNAEVNKLQNTAETDPVRMAIYGDLHHLSTIKPDEMIKRAIAAFGKRQFLLLADGHQCTHLEEVVHLKPSSKVKFLRITPLVGG